LRLGGCFFAWDYVENKTFLQILSKNYLFMDRNYKKRYFLKTDSLLFLCEFVIIKMKKFIFGGYYMPKIAVKKLDERAVLPTYGSEYAAGADLYAVCDSEVVIAPDETKLIHTGLSMEIPEGYAGFIYARSGLASKRGLAPANKVGVVDADYRGEVMVALHNHSGVEQKIAHGERIAQLVVAPFLKVDFEESDTLSDTVRGTGGFGSTGTK
jgi:dUTP pyrophosphatase